MEEIARFLMAAEADDRPAMRDLLLGPGGGAVADFLIDHYAMADAAGTPDPPSRFGRFLLLDGGTPGGFSEVFRAWDVGLRCVVALKRPWAGADEAELGRFVTEAQLLAGLHHAGIVPIREFDEWEEVPYFTMPWCERGSLQPGRGAAPAAMHPVDAARQLVQIAAAVGYAHAHGVLHMDLKPSNVLRDDHGRPLVADFGLALRPLPGGPPPDARRGTPEYMSSEQAAELPKEPTVLTDVYGLGAVLFFALTGRPPLQGESAEDVIRRACCERRASPRDVNPAVPADLDAICRKCLELDPADRYPTADAFADDLKAWLGFRPTRALPPGRFRRAALWCARHPATTAVLAAAAVVVAMATVIAAQSAAQARASAVARGRSDLFRVLADEPMSPPRVGWRDRAVARVREWLAQNPGSDSELRDRFVGLLQKADARELATRSELHAVEASSVAFGGDPDGPALLGGLGAGRPARLWFHETDEIRELTSPGPGPVGFRGGVPVQLTVRDETGVELWDLAAPRRILRAAAPRRVAVLPNGLPALAMTATGDRLAAAWADGVAVWDGRTGRRLLERSGPTPRAMAFSGDGRYLALGGGGGRVCVVAVAGGPDVLLPSPFGVDIHSLAFGPDGDRLAAGYVGSVTVFRLDGGRAVAHCHGGHHATDALAWSADGTLLLAAGGQAARLFDSYSGVPVLDLPAGHATSAAVAADGRFVVGSMRRFGRQSRTTLWHLESGRGFASLQGLVGLPQIAATDDRGDSVAVLTSTRQVGVFGLAAGEPRGGFRVATADPEDTTDNWSMAFTRDGAALAVASGGRAVLWDAAGRTESASWDLNAGGVTNALSASADGRLLLFRAEGGKDRRFATLYELGRGRPPAVLYSHRTPFRRVTRSVASPRGDRFAYFACGQGWERLLVVVDASGRESWRVRLDQENHDAALSTDAASRLLFVHPLNFPRPLTFEFTTGRPCATRDAWPMCLSHEGGAGISYGSSADGVNVWGDVTSGGAAPVRFRIGPVIDRSRAFLASQDARRLVFPDAQGAAVVCDVAEVAARLKSIGLD